MTKVEKAKKTPPINPVPSAASKVEAQTSCLMDAAVMISVSSRFNRILSDGRRSETILQKDDPPLKFFKAGGNLPVLTALGWGELADNQTLQEVWSQICEKPDARPVAKGVDQPKRGFLIEIAGWKHVVSDGCLAD